MKLRLGTVTVANGNETLLVLLLEFAHQEKLVAEMRNL